MAVFSGHDSISTFQRGQTYYRDMYRLLCKIAVGLAVIVCVLILVQVIVAKKYVPNELYYTTTADGDLTQIYPLDQPHLDGLGLQKWAQFVLPQIFTFKEGEFEATRRKSLSYFTRAGAQGYSNLLAGLKVKEQTEAGRKITTTVDELLPIGFLGYGITPQENAFYWVISVPVQITVTDVKTKKDFTPTNLRLRVLVKRGLDLDARDGILIQELAVGGA